MVVVVTPNQGIAFSKHLEGAEGGPVCAILRDDFGTIPASKKKTKKTILKQL